MSKDVEYWEKYYENNMYPKECSNFALFVNKYLEDKKNYNFIEIGCGNGRDLNFFVNQYHNIVFLGVDQCKNEIDRLNKYLKNYNNLKFIAMDFTKLEIKKGYYNYIYSRFSLHSISEIDEDRVLTWIKDSIANGGYFFLEARSTKDDLYGQGKHVGKNAFFTDHYRRFIDFDEIVNKIEKIGLKVIYKIEGRGMAKYISKNRNEDPVVIRLVACKTNKNIKKFIESKMI